MRFLTALASLIAAGPCLAWLPYTSTDRLSGVRTTSVTLPAATVSAYGGPSYRPGPVEASLYIECADKQLLVGLLAGNVIFGAISGNTVQWRFDKEPMEQSADWIGTTSGGAIALVDQKQARSFLEKINKHRSLIIRASSSFAATVEADFVLAGSEAALTPVLSECPA